MPVPRHYRHTLGGTE